MGYPHISSRVFPPAMAGRKVRFLAFGLTLSILIFGFFINYHHHSYVWEPALVSSALVVGTMPHSTSVRFRRVGVTSSKKKDIAVWFKAARQFPLFHGFLEQSFGVPFDIDPKTGEYRAIKPEDC